MSSYLLASIVILIGACLAPSSGLLFKPDAIECHRVLPPSVNFPLVRDSGGLKQRRQYTGPQYHQYPPVQDKKR